MAAVRMTTGTPRRYFFDLVQLQAATLQLAEELYATEETAKFLGPTEFWRLQWPLFL